MDSRCSGSKTEPGKLSLKTRFAPCPVCGQEVGTSQGQPWTHYRDTAPQAVAAAEAIVRQAPQPRQQVCRDCGEHRYPTHGIDCVMSEWGEGSHRWVFAD